MTTYSIRVYDRSGNSVLPPFGVLFSPSRWSAEAEGGPKAAEIELDGPVDALLALSNWLGFQVNILADNEVVWWGQLDTLNVTADGLSRELTLDGVANRVKVLYSIREPGGNLASGETAWMENATSIAAYGVRELVHSASGSLTDLQAGALQTRLLAALSTPQRKLKIGKAQRGGKMLCRGYWQRLEDVYYQQLAGLEEYSENSNPIPLGLGFTSTKIGFGGQEGAKQIAEVDGKFKHFPDYDGLKILVSGTSSNNGVKTVAGGDARDVFTRTSSTVSFDAADDITDSAGGLSDLATGDVIWISGAATGSNNGAKLVKTAGYKHIEISPGWSGGDIVNGAAGPAVTIQRGNGITLEEVPTTERPNGSTIETITAYGQKIYQTFSLASNTTWTVARIEVRARKVGSPADALRLQLVLDSAGSPGTVLETVTVDAAHIETAMDWLAFVLANTTSISYGTTYGLLLDRTGSMDYANFYEIDVVPDGTYSRGTIKLHDGTTYQADAANSDLAFRALGAQDTAYQMRDVLDGVDVELTGVVVENTSGVAVLQYQAGDETAMAIATSLLEQGTSTGERLLCTVMEDRRVRLYKQPAATEKLLVWRGGQLSLATGGELKPGWLPVARWVHVDDLVMSGAWAGLSPVFVERATYQVGSGLSFDAEYQEPLAGALRGVANK